MFIDTLMQVCISRDRRVDQVTACGLLNSVRFQIDNVARYVSDNSDYKRPYYIEKHIPNMAPLAPYMWFEYNGVSIGKTPKECYGCLLTIDYGREEGIKTKKWEDIDISQRRWIIRAEYFYIEHGSNGSFDLGSSDWVYFISVGDDGQILGTNSIASQRFLEPDFKPDETQRDIWHFEVVTAFSAICFAHCKGAEIKEHQPSRQVRRHAERKGEPTYSYRTIDIGPASRVLREEGDIANNGLGKALHICRGHFAHYTADKPLFGKYVGTVYKPMHLRGKAENGVVEKDYKVHAEVK